MFMKIGNVFLSDCRLFKSTLQRCLSRKLSFYSTRIHLMNAFCLNCTFSTGAIASTATSEIRFRNQNICPPKIIADFTKLQKFISATIQCPLGNVSPSVAPFSHTHKRLGGLKEAIAETMEAWLPDGYSQIFISYVFGPPGFWTMASLRCAAKFDPFLSLDCAPTPSTLAQSKERKGSNFAIWQPCLQVPRLPIPAGTPGGVPEDRGLLAHPRGAPLLRRRLPGG